MSNSRFRTRARWLIATPALLLVAVPASAEVVNVLGFVQVATAGEDARGIVAVSNGGMAEGHVAVSNGGESRGFVLSVSHGGHANRCCPIFGGGGDVGLVSIATTGPADGTVAVSPLAPAGQQCWGTQVAVSVTGDTCAQTLSVSGTGHATGPGINIGGGG